MHDYIDFFIGQALKNWAVRQELPDHGRKRLLLSAESLVLNGHSEDAELFSKTPGIHYRCHHISRSSRISTTERLFEPIEQNRLWLHHFSPSLLMNLA